MAPRATPRLARGEARGCGRLVMVMMTMPVVMVMPVMVVANAMQMTAVPITVAVVMMLNGLNQSRLS